MLMFKRDPKPDRPRADSTLSESLSSSSAGLDTARFICQIAAIIGDGTIVIPGLKAIAQLGLEIIKIAQELKAHKEDCIELAQRIAGLLHPVAEILQDQNYADLEPRFQADLIRFQKELENILDTLRAQSNCSNVQRFRIIISGSTGNESIAKCKELVDQVCQKFSLYAMIDLRSIVGQLRQQIQPVLSNSKSCVPFRLQPPPEIFYGRDDFLSEMLSLILKSVQQARLAILGAAGMGKTAAALKILHHEGIASHFQDQRYFVACESATTANMLVSAILQMLDVQQGAEVDGLVILHQHLSSGLPMLLVLDNFETPWEESERQSDIVAVLRTISAAKNVSLVVTM